MTVDELIKRATGEVGRNTIYALGKGRDWRSTPNVAKDREGKCDCSSFVCWCLGLSKFQPFEWLESNLHPGGEYGGWYNTDGIWWDIVKEPTGFFREMSTPRPGTIICYPASWVTRGHAWWITNDQRRGRLPKIGHVGIVVEADKNTGAITKVVHCSNGNYRRTGDAIQVTGPAVFNVPGVVYGWCDVVRA